MTHILNHVQKSGCNGFTDGEIFGQAIHYYEENEIEVGKPINCQVVVNHVVELTEEEKAEARQECSPQIPRGGTPQVAEPQQTVSEKRKPTPTPHYLI
ncbi:PcfK-like family protein [Bacteroides fragilis]|uniref:PcfK-like family protein n=1 Tax=Bacteroides fragilis TaxID=817 RepID=A0AAQ2NDZ4_BACFG|nr:PcfK-like family protein [Bacteroides fragilis]